MEKKALKKYTKTTFLPSDIKAPSKNVQYKPKNNFETNSKTLLKKKYKGYYIIWRMVQIEYSYN